MRRLLSEDRINAALGAAYTGFWFGVGVLVAVAIVAIIGLGAAEFVDRMGGG